MPRGKRYHETGLLLRDGPWLVLRRDDGGTWRLDAAAEDAALVRRRVRVEGVRIGFDRLSVEKIEVLEAT